jgi:uncharacterized protein YuzE
LIVSYDGEGDVLYLSIGKPRPAVTRGEMNGLLVRTNPQTHQVVGLTVLDYEKKFRQLDDISWIEKQSLPDEITDFLERRPVFSELSLLGGIGFSLCRPNSGQTHRLKPVPRKKQISSIARDDAH